MGRKKTSSTSNRHNTKENSLKKLSPQKRYELNQLNEKLLKLGYDTTATTTNDQWNQYVEIEGILERIRNIEADLKTKNNRNRIDAIDQFTKWAIENDAKFDGVKISQFQNYELGLEAEKDFKQGELFAIVPKKMILSIDNQRPTFVSLCSQLPLLQSMPNVKLAILLVIERLDVQSFWKAYIDLLPDRYPTVMNFNVNEMSELKGSSAFGMAMNQCKSIARQYAIISKFLQNVRDEPTNSILCLLKERFTYDLYRWAVSTVMTRQNLISLQGISPTPSEFSPATPNNTVNGISETSPALIPLWDFANHMDGVVTTSYNVLDGHIEGATLVDVSRGEQIFIHYGKRNNTNLLVHNGFVMRDNLSDSVTIRLGLSQSDVLFNKRLKLLENIGLSKSNEITVLPAPKYISPELLGFVRVFNMNEEQLDHWLAPEKCATDLLYLDCALDTALEKKTWTFLKTRLTLLLNSFPTTLDEDLATLNKSQNKHLGHVKSMILQYRVCEKLILRQALDYIGDF